MSIEEFEMMEIGAFFLKLFYANQKEREERQFYGNIMRLQTMLLMNVQIDQKSRIRHPEQLWKYECDEDNEKDGESLTDQEKLERFELLRKVAKKHLNG